MRVNKRHTNYSFIATQYYITTMLLQLGVAGMLEEETSEGDMSPLPLITSTHHIRFTASSPEPTFVKMINKKKVMFIFFLINSSQSHQENPILNFGSPKFRVVGNLILALSISSLRNSWQQ